jgi:hypothetical protein
MAGASAAATRPRADPAVCGFRPLDPVEPRSHVRRTGLRAGPGSPLDRLPRQRPFRRPVYYLSPVPRLLRPDRVEASDPDHLLPISAGKAADVVNMLPEPSPGFSRLTILLRLLSPSSPDPPLSQPIETKVLRHDSPEMRKSGIVLRKFSRMLPVDRVKLLIDRVKQQDPRVKQQTSFPENVTAPAERAETLL